MSADPLLDRLARALAGRYTVARELGRGGMATVYLATDVKLGRRVAIKVLPPTTAPISAAAGSSGKSCSPHSSPTPTSCRCSKPMRPTACSSM